ncbi:unnamed protein product [Calypogeia fissa]
MVDEGEEHITKEPPPPVEVQERGEIFFFYRPKVNQESPQSIDDVQRMYIVLRPISGEKKVEEKQSSDSGKEAKFRDRRELENREGSHCNADEQMEQATAEEQTIEIGKRTRPSDVDDQIESKKMKAGRGAEQDDNSNAGGHGTEKVQLSKNTLLRLIVIGRKRLPDPSKRSRPFWGFVELVSTDPDDLKQALSSEEYETKTKGNRTRPGSRPVGEGVYRIIRHKKGKQMHTHLVYKLELPGPDKNHVAQEALNVEPQASYLIQVKNPQHGAPPSAGLQNRRKAEFPKHLLEKFGSYRFVAADPPDLLNYEGCEFILISGSDDIEEELGMELNAKDVGHPECSDLLSMFTDFEKDVKAPILPLIEGEWA